MEYNGKSLSKDEMEAVRFWSLFRAALRMKFHENLRGVNELPNELYEHVKDEARAEIEALSQA